MLRNLARLTTAAVLVLGAAACADSTTSPDLDPGPDSSRNGFTLLLTDAPGDFHSAVITISEINLHGSGGSVNLIDDDDPYTVDLIDLRNEVATIVDDIELPAGDYSELRLVITGGYIEVEGDDGRTRIFASSPDYHALPPGARVDGQLHMPSMGQSGLKVKLPEHLQIGEEETIVMIDFDVEESFGHEAGKSGRWIMHPVIRATDVTFGGNLLVRVQLADGVVLPELAGELLSLVDLPVVLEPVGSGDSRTGRLSATDDEDVFELMFKGLVPGDYRLALELPGGIAASFSPALPLVTTVLERETTTETITLTSIEVLGSVATTLELADTVSLPVVDGEQITLGDFDAQLVSAAGDTITVGYTDGDEDGVYEAVFPDLPADDYSLSIIAPDGVTATFSAELPIQIELLEGEAETHAVVVTAATTS